MMVNPTLTLKAIGYKRGEKNALLKVKVLGFKRWLYNKVAECLSCEVVIGCFRFKQVLYSAKCWP